MLGLSTLVHVSLLEHDHTYSVYRLLGLVFRHDFLQGKRESPTPQPRHMSSTSRDTHVKRVDVSPYRPSSTMTLMSWVGAMLIAVLAILVQLASSHTIDLHPESEYCFYEDMHVGDEMTLTYQVSGGGHLDIDTTVRDPSGRLLFEQKHKDTGTYDFVADTDGRHQYCFSNKFSVVTDKTLSFNVHGVLYLTEEEGLIPAERELRDLANNIQLFKDEQEYLSMRERVHRNTAESTNSRVKWWSILQTLLIVAVVAFQVYFVKRFVRV